MSELTRRTFLPMSGLLCNGPEAHFAEMPIVHTDGPTGGVRCGECGASMRVVDIIVVENTATWADLDYLRGKRRRYFGV